MTMISKNKRVKLSTKIIFFLSIFFSRDLGGIPKLVDLLSSDVPEIQKNACGCLKNLAFGKENDLNKVIVF